MKATVGATLVTVTGWVAMLLLSLSESVTRILTSGLAGPSGKRHWKVPPLCGVVSEPAT